MNTNQARMALLPLIATAAVLLCLAGCKTSQSEHPSEHPEKMPTAAEHPSEHPTS